MRCLCVVACAGKDVEPWGVAAACKLRNPPPGGETLSPCFTFSVHVPSCGGSGLGTRWVLLRLTPILVLRLENGVFIIMGVGVLRFQVHRVGVIRSDLQAVGGGMMRTPRHRDQACLPPRKSSTKPRRVGGSGAARGVALGGGCFLGHRHELKAKALRRVVGTLGRREGSGCLDGVCSSPITPSSWGLRCKRRHV